jgi:hypothetical protein
VRDAHVAWVVSNAAAVLYARTVRGDNLTGGPSIRTVSRVMRRWRCACRIWEGYYPRYNPFYRLVLILGKNFSLQRKVTPCTYSRTCKVRGRTADQVSRLIRSCLSLGSKPFRLKLSRCCCKRMGRGRCCLWRGSRWQICIAGVSNL